MQTNSTEVKPPAIPKGYAHMIEPVFHNGKYLPNNKALKDAKKNSPVGILPCDFERHQRAGNTILINFNGGWCFPQSIKA